MAATPVALTEPLMMFGVYVESFTSSVGYGAESSTMQMTLVEDENNLTQKEDAIGLLYWTQDTVPVETYDAETCAGPLGTPPCTPNLPVMVPDPITLKHSLDSGLTFINGLPEVGTVCQFIFKEFEFVGIFQRYSYSQSSGGRKYDVTFESPSKVLDGVQVILSSFEGTKFWDNTIYPSEDVNFTSQINNVYNPFGIKENYAWGLNYPTTGPQRKNDDRSYFGGSDYNEAGFLVPDNLLPVLSGQPHVGGKKLRRKGLLTLIEEISKSMHTFDNPCGSYNAQGNCVAEPAPDTSFNHDDHELIGGPIHFGDSKFVIEFGDLKDLVPDFFRIKGPVKSISAIVQECCEIIIHDYVSYIKSFNSEPDPNLPPIYRNGVVPIQIDEDRSSDRYKDVIGPVISFKYLDKSVQPTQGVVAQLVEDSKVDGTLVSADNGREYADAVTQKLIIGDSATRVWEADIGHLIPTYGKDHNGDYIMGTGFALDDDVIVQLTNGGTYTATVMELRCALSGQDTWAMYQTLLRIYGTSALTDNMYGSLSAWGTNMATRYLQGTAAAAAGQTGFDGNHHKVVLDQSNNSRAKELLSEYYNAVVNAANKFWGKTYFVMLPVEPGGIDNNIRYKNTGKWDTESAWEIADAGWDPNHRVTNVDMYNNEGALKACAAYYGSRVEQGTKWRRDFGSIEKTVEYISGGGTSLIASEIQVDKKIYWRTNPYFVQGSVNNAYEQTTAMVHITCPRVFEEDAYATEKSGMDSLFAHIAGATAVGKLGYRGKGRKSPDVETSAGKGSNPATLLTNHTGLRMAPNAVRPFRISIPQKSTRYSWGPWYKYSVDPVTGDPIKIGKAEVAVDTSLKPETFGSKQLLSDAGFALAEAGTADMYATESGSVDLAEFPRVNTAERMVANGPYVTKMDVSVGVGGITTKYQFSTWTRNFGKIAKYNIDRIASAHKLRMRILKEGTSAGGPNVFDSGVTKPQDRAPALNGGSMNFFMGLHVPSNVGGGAAANPMGPGCFDMASFSGSTIHNSLGREVTLYNGVKVSAYDLIFGCTPDQIFSPFGIEETLGDGAGDFLPFMRKPLTQGGVIQENTKDTIGFFEGEYLAPTSKDLDPYFFATSKGSKSDFGAVVQGTAGDIQGGKSMHYNNNQGKLLSTSMGVRTIGLRGPILLSGWGYDVVGMPVPGDGAGWFHANMMENRANMRHGPVDLRWDEERQVWAGGLQFLEGILTEKVEPAKHAKKDGEWVITPDKTGRMKVRRKTATKWENGNRATGKPTEYEWKDNAEEIKITNRDPSLSVDPEKAEYPIYVMVARINYEWRIVYISCDNFEEP